MLKQHLEGEVLLYLKKLSKEMLFPMVNFLSHGQIPGRKTGSDHQILVEAPVLLGCQIAVFLKHVGEITLARKSKRC